MSEREWKNDKYPLPSDALRAGALRMKVKPGYVVIKRAKAPEAYGIGLLEIPRAYRDEPMEGHVVAVGTGRPFFEHYCTGLAPDGTYADCGQLATWRLLPHDEYREEKCPDPAEQCLACDRRGSHRVHDDLAPRIFVCDACVARAHAHGTSVPAEDGTRRPCTARPLLTERPLGIRVGDRVVFSKWAGGKQAVDVFGESLIMTDDVLGIVEDGAGLVTRIEAA